MIPRMLFAAVAALLAIEGYSVLTAPPSLVRQAVAKALEASRVPLGSDPA